MTKNKSARGEPKVVTNHAGKGLDDKSEISDKGDISNKGDITPSGKPQDHRALIGLEDELSECIFKVALLCDCFCPHRHEDELFSPKGLKGFRVILRDTEDDLCRVVDGMKIVRNEGGLVPAGKQTASAPGNVLEMIGTARAKGMI